MSQNRTKRNLKKSGHTEKILTTFEQIKEAREGKKRRIDQYSVIYF